MKTKLFLLFSISLFSVSAFSQKLPVDSETQKVAFSEVVEVPGVNKNELYGRALTWFAKTYGSSKSVLEIQDKDGGKLFGKGLTDVTFKNPPMGSMYGGTVSYTISVIVKDGKYKYSITDFNHSGGTDTRIADGGGLENEKRPKGIGFPSQKQWDQIKDDVNTKTTSLATTLKSALLKSETDF